jgi:diguanylate cyclase (GGDEF)-like protein
MSLKNKVLLSLICLFFLYGVLDYGIQRFIVLPKFAELEKNQARENLQRTVFAIESEVGHLNSACHDWAAWDDTYTFVNYRGDEYIRANLAFDSFKSLGINLLYYCDLRGRVVWGKIYDLHTGNELDLAEFPADALPADHPLLQQKLTGMALSDASTSGVYVTGKGPILVAARPILMSNNIGPVMGTLIMGKFLDKAYVEKLVEQTRQDFTILRDPRHEASLLGSSTFVIGKSCPYHIDYRDNDLLFIDALYPDIMGKTAFIIRNTLKRDIMHGGYEAIRFALITLIVAGLCVVLLTLFFMERTLLHPVTNLTKHVLSISETGNFSLRLRVNRRDEIGTLAQEFDRMLGKIEDMSVMMETMNDQLIDDIQKRHEMEKKLQEANRQLETLASMDGLTRLSNRRKFDEYIALEWKRGIRDKDPLSLIILDVDFFKVFNDTYGHQAGDDCLRSVAGVIGSNTKRVPDLAARYGGEEFAVILPATDLEGALHLAEAIRTKVQGLAISHEMSEANQCVTVSAGVASVIPAKDSSPDELIRMADMALYEAKAAGRNRTVAKKEIERLQAVQS